MSQTNYTEKFHSYIKRNVCACEGVHLLLVNSQYISELAEYLTFVDIVKQGHSKFWLEVNQKCEKKKIMTRKKKRTNKFLLNFVHS